MPRAKLDEILKEVQHGEMKIIVKDGVVVSIPPQRIEGSPRHGVKSEKVISESIEIDGG